MNIKALLSPEHKKDTLEALSHMGFHDAVRALDNIQLIADGVDSPLFLEIIPSLVTACAQSADPDGCINNFERVSNAAESRESFLSTISWHPEGVKILAPILASSLFLTRFMMGEPEDTIGWLLASGRLDGPRERDEFIHLCLKECPADTPLIEAMARLRRFKYMEFLRITARDLLGRSDIPESTMELSNLADAACEAAYRVASRELDSRHGQPRYTAETGRMRRCPFTIIAMGKMGGRELNFSSDIDIMYVYKTDKGVTAGPGKITNHQYFVKLSEMISRIIGENTSDGFVFRVDTKLRPEGSQGDLAQSLGGYELYYESWGQTWERSALIKARPCAGDMALGRDFIETVRPFVYRKYLDYAAIGEITQMKVRIEKHAHNPKEIDFKTGIGGIREVEFFISALQLIYGGRDYGIRERSTFKALHKLAIKNLITFEEQQELARAYVFLRMAEHRAQLVDERQTHSVLDTPGDIHALARRMGYAGIDAGVRFMAELRAHTARVREIYGGLLAEQPVDVLPATDEYDYIISAELGEPEAARLLEARGFRESHRAYTNLTLIRDGSPGSPLTPRSRNMFMRILPALIAGCAASPDPDMALNRLESFIASFGSREAIYEMISQKPEAALKIPRLLGSSEYFSRLLITYPEISEALILADEKALEKPRVEMIHELGELMDKAENFAAAMDALRRYKHEEELRIGVWDIFAVPGTAAVSRQLSALAEVMLGAALDISVKDTVKRFGIPGGGSAPPAVAVIGFGKLGAGELGYGSDLDITFIYSGGGAQEFASRTAERVIFALSTMTREGVAFPVDTRLRPGGSKGLIAHSIEGLKGYYEKSASIWEFQALTRARGISGAPSLIESFESLRMSILTTSRDASELAASIKSMRQKIERQHSKKSGLHIKHGRGGIVDIEFIVQFLQLAKGHDTEDILIPGTPEALGLITQKGLLDKADGERLTESFKFMKELESRLRITTSQAETVLPDDPGRLGSLAARMGYPGRPEDAAAALRADFVRHAAEVREIFDRVVDTGGGNE